MTRKLLKQKIQATLQFNNQLNQTYDKHNNTIQQSKQPSLARNLLSRSPRLLKTQKGREIPEWSVYQGDDQGNPAGRVYQLRDHQRAETLAQAMSQRQGLGTHQRSCRRITTVRFKHFGPLAESAKGPFIPLSVT